MQACDDLIAERPLAPKQVRAAGNVEKQALWRIEDNDGREAFAPGGDVIECACVFVRISFDGGELGMDGARVCERHGQPQAERGGARINARQQEGAGFLGIDSEGAALRRLP